MENNRLYILAVLLLAFVYACNLDDDLTKKRKIVPKKFTFKKPRLDFAKFVGDNNETCSTSNTDSSAMDYHNNAIGRALFDRLTTYRSRTIFWITITYGLNTPSEYTLRREAIKILRTPSRKKYITTKGIPKDSKEHVKICFRKHAIEQTSKKKAVYFVQYQKQK